MPDNNKDNSNSVSANASDVYAIRAEDLAKFAPVIANGITLCNGAYRLDKRLASNELGEHWMATNTQANKSVIIYLPPADIRKDKSEAKPVKRTAKHISALKHARIVPILEHCTDPEHGFFVVREFVNGNPLGIYWKNHVKQHGKLTPERILSILNSIALALDYAHRVNIVSEDKVRSVGVIHGSLCPNDIIVGLDDEIYLDNFMFLPTLALKSAERKPYLAPEVVEGQDATAASDIYSLGVIAYELLTGRLPFLPDAKDDVPPPIPDVPGLVDVIVRKAMASAPSGRFDTCGVFVGELARCFQETQEANPFAATALARQQRVKSVSIPSLVLGVAVVFLLLAVGGIAFLSQQPSKESGDHVAPPQAKQQERGQVKEQPVREARAEAARVVPPSPYKSPLADIYEAAASGTVEDIRYFLGRDGRVNQKDNDGMSLLHHAALNPDAEVAKFLVEQGADVRAKNNANQTPMDVISGQMQAEKRTIFRTAGVMYSDIFSAAASGTVDDVRYFLDKGVKVDQKEGKHGNTSLHCAAWHNSDVEVVKYLVLLGATVDVKNKWGSTPLHLAAGNNSNIEILKYLVAQGANIHTKTNDDWTPLHAAARNNLNVEIVKYLVSQGTDVNERTNSGSQPLHLAACYNPNVEIVNYLVSQGAKVNVGDDSGWTPLHHAAGWNSLEVVKYLVSQGADINAKNIVPPHVGFTPTHSAVTGNSSVEVLKYLISLGVDVNAKINNGKTPLDFANTVEKRAVLRAAGARYSDIFVAAASGTVDDVRYLVSQGADVKAKNNLYTPLHAAAAGNSNAEIVKYLISQGADVNAKNNWGATPLHFAARSNSNVEVLRHLVAKGATVNVKKADGSMPLHLAAQSNPNAGVLKYLISQGANVNAKNNKGETPLDVANTEEKKAILRAVGGRSGR